MKKFIFLLISSLLLICCNKSTKVDSQLHESRMLYSPLSNAYVNEKFVGSSAGSPLSLSECMRLFIKENLGDSILNNEAWENYLACVDKYFEDYVPPAPPPSSSPEQPIPVDNRVPDETLRAMEPFTDSASCQHLLGLISPGDFVLLNQAIVAAYNSNESKFHRMSSVDKYEAILQSGSEISGYDFESMFLFVHEVSGNYLPVKPGSNPMANMAYIHSISIESSFPPSILDEFYSRPVNAPIVTEFPLKDGEPLPDIYFEFWGPYKVVIDNSSSNAGTEPEVPLAPTN